MKDVEEVKCEVLKSVSGDGLDGVPMAEASSVPLTPFKVVRIDDIPSDSLISDPRRRLVKENSEYSFSLCEYLLNEVAGPDQRIRECIFKYQSQVKQFYDETVPRLDRYLRDSYHVTSCREVDLGVQLAREFVMNCNLKGSDMLEELFAKAETKKQRYRLKREMTTWNEVYDGFTNRRYKLTQIASDYKQSLQVPEVPKEEKASPLTLPRGEENWDLKTSLMVDPRRRLLNDGYSFTIHACDGLLNDLLWEKKDRVRKIVFDYKELLGKFYDETRKELDEHIVASYPIASECKENDAGISLVRTFINKIRARNQDLLEHVKERLPKKKQREKLAKERSSWDQVFYTFEKRRKSLVGEIKGTKIPALETMKRKTIGGKGV